ncbi:hypothetical protein AA313_de0202592 [Arthrobotrys entomopaga]|nr:hypothetical protein AA313_de0202592 [Arthrobotrys entomopaga]
MAVPVPDNSNVAQRNPKSTSNGDENIKNEKTEVGKKEEKEEREEPWTTKLKTNAVEWFNQLAEDLRKDHLWQHIFKCSIATTCAPVAKAYGPAVFLSSVASVFGHPGRNLGAMFETLIFALIGTLVGTGWVTLASYISDALSKTNTEKAHAFRAVVLALSLMIHGYLRSKVPKFFVGVLLFLLTVIIQMTTPVFTFTHQVATAFLYPFLTGIVLCTLANVLIFPEFSSGKVAVVTVEALELTLEALRDATDFFVSSAEELQRRKSTDKGKIESTKPQGAKSVHGTTEGKKSKKSWFFWNNSNAKDEDKEVESREQKEDEQEEKEEDPLKNLLAAKDKLRKAVASSKAILKETSFELSFSCLPPDRLHDISSKGLDALVTSALTLIVACETKHIVMGPTEQEEKESESDKESETEEEEEGSEKNSLIEKLENIRPKREAEAADEDFLRQLLERVHEPLESLRNTVRRSVHVLIACIEFSFDVPITSNNISRKPKGIPLKEIDIYMNAIENSLVEFDKRTREALHTAAEKASEEEEYEFDILPREELFLVSSFLLNFRLVAGEAEQSEAMDAGAKENVSRYQKATEGSNNGDKKANTKQQSLKVDKKRLANGPSSTQKQPVTKKDKKASNEDSKKEQKKAEEEQEKKPSSTRIRDGLADIVDWITTSRHLHYAIKLTIGGMLLSWPAFVPEFSLFYYNYRGLWVLVIYVLVFENSVGSSIQVFAYRTVGTICGSLWGYAAWSAGHGNPYVIAVMLYFGFLIGFYIQLNTRYSKSGMVLIMSMVIVSVGTLIEYIPGTVPGTALENFLKRSIAMITGGSGALIVQSVIFPVRARVMLVETVGTAVLKINEMESAIAFGVDQMANISDLRNENAVKAFSKAKKKAEVSLAAASAYFHEALTSKLPLPQYFPSARLAQLRMVNRVRQLLMETVSSTTRSKEAQVAADTKRILRVEFMSYNASSAALEQVIEWLEELVDLTKLLRGAAEFRFGLLSRPTYKEWVRQISIGGEVDGPAGEKERQHVEAIEEQHHQLARVPSRSRKQETDDDIMEGEDGLPETLRRVQSRHRENRRRLSQTSQGLPERVVALRRAVGGGDS